MENKQAIIYVRASTNEVKQGNSHEMQLHSIREFAKSHGYEVVKVFREYASGTLDERPVFRDALAYADDHNTFILAYRLDRGSRSLTIFNQLNPGIFVLENLAAGAPLALLRVLVLTLVWPM